MAVIVDLSKVRLRLTTIPVHNKHFDHGLFQIISFALSQCVLLRGYRRQLHGTAHLK